jgi:hypothetical protein
MMIGWKRERKASLPHVYRHTGAKKASKKGFSQTIAGSSSSSKMVVACVLKENGLRM